MKRLSRVVVILLTTTILGMINLWSGNGITTTTNWFSSSLFKFSSSLIKLPNVNTSFTLSRNHLETIHNHSSNHSSIIYDSGYDFNQTEDLVSDSISFCCSVLSTLSALIVFVMFYMEHSWIFSFENKSKKMNYSKTLKQAIMELGCCQWFPNNQNLYLEISKMERRKIFIQRAKRKFIRRMMLSLLVSDLICSVSRILFIAWWWICSMGAPESMFERKFTTVQQGNGTAVNSTWTNFSVHHAVNYYKSHNSLLWKHSLFPMKSQVEENFFPISEPFLMTPSLAHSNLTQPNITILRAYYVMKSAPLTIHKFFVHLIYAFTLSTATWCVIVAFAIFATTRQFKWLEEDITKKVDQSLDNIASFNSNYSEDSKAQFDSTTNSSIHAMALLSSTPTAQELQTKSMTISIPSQANSPKQRNVLKTIVRSIRKMSRKTFFEICFHVVAWGIAIVTFVMLFFFRIISIHSDVSKDSEIQYITTLYISWAIYFTGTICLNFTILISIWRYLGHYFNNSQLQVIPKKETKRRQKYVIVKMTLLLLPYILCGIFELAYWCYSAASTVLDKDDEGFILVFYNFFFNTIVPLKGFFFGVAFLFGAPKIRSFFSYLCCCCCHQVKRGRYDSGISTNYAHPQLNTQTLLTEQEQEEATSTTNDYPSQSPQIGTSSHYYYLNDSSRRVENDKRQNGWKEDKINYDEIAFGRLDSRAESVIIHNPMSGSMNHVRMRQKTWHAQSSLSNVNSPNTSPTPQQQTQNVHEDRVVDQVENLENHQ